MIVSSLTKAIIMSILICSVCSNKTSYNPRILSLKAKHLSTYIGRGYDIYRVSIYILVELIFLSKYLFIFNRVIPNQISLILVFELKYFNLHLI